jgi:hypothetical protein
MGFIICAYDEILWLTHMLQVSGSEVQVTFLHHSDQSKSFTHPSPANSGVQL